MCQVLGNYSSNEQKLTPARLELRVQWVCPDAEPRVPHAQTGAALNAGEGQLGNRRGDEGMPGSVLNSEGRQAKDGNWQSRDSS